MKKISMFISRWMAVIVLAAAGVSMLWPQVGGLVRTAWTVWLLAGVMLGMGLMLRWEDFRVVFRRPWDVLLVTALQFVVMPLLGWTLAQVFRLPPELAVGVILVGCCPGGTASNVMTFLAGGDLALSVGATCVSTLLAPVVTPLLMWLLAGQMVEVDVVKMFLNIVQVVIVPIALGITVRRFAPKVCDKIAPLLPAFSTLAIALIVLAVVAANQQALLTSGVLLLIVVALHNGMGFALGYLGAWLFRLLRPKRIAISIEVGMQNSGLACSLAHQHFASMAMAGAPGAIFSVWHNIAGALLARFFKRRSILKERQIADGHEGPRRGHECP